MLKNVCRLYQGRYSLILFNAILDIHPKPECSLTKPIELKLTKQDARFLPCHALI